MKIIFAQGNPGEQYARTRHNVGFFALDLYAKVHGVEWATKTRFKAVCGLYEGSEGQVLLVKPTTYYNASGEALGAVMGFYKVSVEDVLVICDDLNLPFGTVRTRREGSDGGNNGLKSIISVVGQEFARVRIGTDSDQRAVMGDVDFVLSKFTSEEMEQIPGVLGKVGGLVDDFIGGKFETRKAH